MNNLPNLFVIVKKIKIYRLRWLIRRIKQELRYPSYSVGRVIAVRVESFRVLLRRLYRPRIVDKHSEHQVVVWDFNNKPATFDFAPFLAHAETFARNNGKETLFVYFVMNKGNESLGENSYDDIVDKDSQKWRFNNIIIPLVNVYPACVGYSVLSKGASITPYLEAKSVFPEGYSDSFDPPISDSEIYDALELNIFTGFKPSTQSLRYIKKWHQSKGIKTPIVCITLRQYDYDKSRNSDIAAWVQFAAWVFERGYTPVFIPDTDACWESSELIDKYHVFNEGCWNLELRLALYELAYVNYFYCNGCAYLATLSRTIRYIVMMPTIEGSLQSGPHVNEAYGWSEDQRREKFAEDYQFLSFKTDSFENIRDEFLEFIAVNG